MKKMILKIEDLEERIAPSMAWLDVSAASANSWHGSAGSHELPDAAGAASENSWHGDAGSRELPEAAGAAHAHGKSPVIFDTQP